MRWKEGEPFEYWIGIFMLENAAVPGGYEYHDFPKATLGVCWIYGKEPDVYMREEDCGKKLEENGYEIIKDHENAHWFFERYVCPRFTTPDENDKVILDICHFVK